SLDGEALRPPSPDDVLLWVSADQLERSEALRLPNGSAHRPPEDVRLPALEAIRRERGLAAPS
ncbi:MAG: hypothetical protein U1B78_08140, partial [Dehalococcoidia bacterium]|nr:hypothetical protein [Dehalococcoidia bacterium]